MTLQKYFGIGLISGLALLAGCSDAPRNNEGFKVVSHSLADANSLNYDPVAVSNFCNELIASRDSETTRRCFTGSQIDANKAYVLKLTEIIASLKGDGYSSEAYNLARSEFHNAVEAYTK